MFVFQIVGVNPPMSMTDENGDDNAGKHCIGDLLVIFLIQVRIFCSMMIQAMTRRRSQLETFGRTLRTRSSQCQARTRLIWTGSRPSMGTWSMIWTWLRWRISRGRSLEPTSLTTSTTALTKVCSILYVCLAFHCLETWNSYCERQRKLRAEYGTQKEVNRVIISSININFNPQQSQQQQNQRVGNLIPLVGDFGPVRRNKMH